MYLFSKSSTICRRGVEIALRCVMIVSLWHAPLPWLHIHAASGAETASNELLDHHLVEFHSDMHFSEALGLGWHFHLVLPWNIQHRSDANADRDAGGCQDIVAAGKYGSTFEAQSASYHALVTWLNWSNDSANISSTTAHCIAALPRHASGALLPPASFLASFLGSVSINDLIDRQLC